MPKKERLEALSSAVFMLMNLWGDKNRKVKARVSQMFNRLQNNFYINDFFYDPWSIHIDKENNKIQIVGQFFPNANDKEKRKTFLVNYYPNKKICILNLKGEEISMCKLQENLKGHGNTFI